MRDDPASAALVLGIGPVGLLGAMTLATAGFTTYVYSRELPPSPRIDLIYEAVGHSHFALQALQVLGINGIFVLTGVPGLQAFAAALRDLDAIRATITRESHPVPLGAIMMCSLRVCARDAQIIPSG